MIEESLGASASEVAERLSLSPCAEGGWWREVSVPGGALRSSLRLLGGKSASRWRRTAGASVWYWQGGAPLQLETFELGAPPASVRLGAESTGVPQALAAPYAWTRLVASEGWSLVGGATPSADGSGEVEMAPERWSPGSPDPRFSPLLERAIGELKAESGSIHLLLDDGVLHLICAKGIPEVVLSMVQRVAVGKGMAGHAVERRGPVTACNIQTDHSGDVRPGALQTGLEGAIVVPIFDDHDGAVGALGVANRSPRTFTPEETVRLIEFGRGVAAARLGRRSAQR